MLLAVQVVPYEPVLCKSCGAVLNPYAQVDFAGRVWLCPLCHVRNALPSQYHGISEQASALPTNMVCGPAEAKQVFVCICSFLHSIKSCYTCFMLIGSMIGPRNLRPGQQQ